MAYHEVSLMECANSNVLRTLVDTGRYFGTLVEIRFLVRVVELKSNLRPFDFISVELWLMRSYDTFDPVLHKSTHAHLVLVNP